MMLYLTERHLSTKADELVQFDMDSIQRVIASRHGEQPKLWLADPDQYERDGRILRDSTTPRLLAYTPNSKTIYVTDGCNSCSHELEADPKALGRDQLERFAEGTGIPIRFLTKLQDQALV